MQEKELVFFCCISKAEYLLSVASLDESVASAERDEVKGNTFFAYIKTFLRNLWKHT